MEQAIAYFFISWIDWKMMLLTAAGTMAGIYVGAIPGLSVTMAISILISFTFSWDLNPALAVMAGVYCGGVYGGSRSSILLNIPGAPSAIASSFDGYPLALRGDAGTAIGLATIASFIGGLLGVLVLAIGAPIVSQFSVMFAPRDYFLLAIMGVLLISLLSHGMLVKGIFAGATGILLAMIGLDPFTGVHRYTYGQVSLMCGVNFVAIMIGLFGVSEALLQCHELTLKIVKQNVDKIIPPWDLIWRNLPLTIRSALIGIGVGALPGAGGDIAALLAYGSAQRSVKKPSRPFGEGAYEGLLAPETANNACIGGAYIPMLTLGIPGDSATAIFIGALLIHGLKPGPMLMIDTPYLFWFIVGNLTLANVFLLLFGFTGIKAFAKIVEIPRGILLPIIIVISVVGSYAINNSMVDVYWMLGFGIFGYFMKLYGFATAPIVLGLILGPIMENGYRRAMLDAHNEIGPFLLGFVTNPISLVFLIFIVWMVLSQTGYADKIKSAVMRKRTSA